MSDNTTMADSSLDLTQFIDEDIAIELPPLKPLSAALTDDMVKFYAVQATKVKNQINVHGAEVSQRHEKMRAINELITEINNATTDNNSLDMTDNEELQEKYNAVVNLGVKLPAGQFKFNSIQRDRLVENLHLTADSWDKENKSQTQKIEILIKELDRYMMVLKEIDRDEKQIKQGMTRGMAGG